MGSSYWLTQFEVVHLDGNANFQHHIDSVSLASRLAHDHSNIYIILTTPMSIFVILLIFYRVFYKIMTHNIFKLIIRIIL